MKFTIRRSVFETNSSSMHTFSWCNKFEPDMLTIPSFVKFETTNFYTGTYLEGIELRANYLYTAAAWADKKDEFEKAIEDISDDLGFKYVFNYYDAGGNIDHQSIPQAEVLIDKVLSNYANLINFLFRDDSECIVVGDYCDDLATRGEDRTAIMPEWYN